jgi:hypothetical protein
MNQSLVPFELQFSETEWQHLNANHALYGTGCWSFLRLAFSIQPCIPGLRQSSSGFPFFTGTKALGS